MRFGGHETFPVREGWLHKGLRTVIEQPELFADEHVQDWLGVGKNMAKSIRHWLLATGLAVISPDQKANKKAVLTATPVGELIWDEDRYFSELATWWILHINLVHAPEHAASWTWFFNSFNFDRFDKGVCVESLKRQLQMSRQRMPSDKTLDRDLSCLLSCYARTIPTPQSDPEDGADCPFRDLELLSHFKSSGYYQLHQRRKPIPAAIVGYAFSKAFKQAREGEQSTDITLQEATRQAGSPGKVFVLSSENLFEVISGLESEDEDDLQIVGLAGERSVRVRQQTPLQWLEQYYAQLREGVQYAA